MLDLINFEDFCNKYTNIDSEEWLTVYEYNKNTYNSIKNDLYTFSVLIDNNNESITKTLSEFTWGFSIDSFGKSYFGKRFYYDHHDKKEEVYFETGEKDDIFEYLFAIRSFNEKYDPSIEINPKLIWYKNLVKVENYYVDPINDEKLIKIEENKIEVQRKYLKDFLSAYNQCCVINFDHRRFYKADSKISYDSSILESNGLKANIVKNSYTYNEFNGLSSMLGKVIIQPFSNPIHRDYLTFTEDEKYETFIIGEDKNTGKEIEFICAEDKLSNFFGANPDAPHFLTPVYFNKKILNNYIYDTLNYTVSDSIIIHLDQWSLPFSINSDDKVIVWLGDLGRIPYSEQKVWKAFNIPPQGDIEDKFLRRQLNCEWTDSSLGEKGLFSKINEINKIFYNKYNEFLFIELSSADIDLESALLIPATNSTPTYQNFLMQLSKVTVERINVHLIGKTLPKDSLKDENGNRFGSRIQLNIFLKQLGISNADRLDNIFKIIYNSRNKLSGHTGSIDEYNKVWGREGFYKPNFISDAKSIILSLNNVLNDIIEELK